MHEQQIPYIERIKDALRMLQDKPSLENTATCAQKLAQLAHEAEVIRDKLREIYVAAAVSDINHIRHIFKMCNCYENEQQTRSH